MSEKISLDSSEDESYNFNVPQYIMDAINWLIDGEK